MIPKDLIAMKFIVAIVAKYMFCVNMQFNFLVNFTPEKSV